MPVPIKTKLGRQEPLPQNIASEQGRLEVVRFLCHAGADEDEATETGATPIFIASCQGHLEVVQFLCDAGADKDKAAEGTTPVASEQGHLEMVRFLCDADADKDSNRERNNTHTHCI